MEAAALLEGLPDGPAGPRGAWQSTAASVPFQIPADIELPTVECPAAPAVTTAELFSGKRSLLVSVPGAFTTICDAVHLPGFVQHADEIRALGLELLFV